MNENHVTFGQLLAGWALDVPDITSVGETYAAMSSVSFEDPITALRDAVQSGEVDAPDIREAIEKAATTLVAGEKARDVIRELSHPLGVRFAAAVLANADSIVEQLQPHFDKAVDDLTKAAKILPADATADMVVGMGQDATPAWWALDRSATILDSLARIRRQMATDYGYRHTGPDVAMFLGYVADNDHLARAATLQRASEPIRGGNWRRLIDANFVLRLNTATEASSVATYNVLAVSR